MITFLITMTYIELLIMNVSFHLCQVLYGCVLLQSQWDIIINPHHINILIIHTHSLTQSNLTKRKSE